MTSFGPLSRWEAIGEARHTVAWAGLVTAVLGPALALLPVPGVVAFLGLVAFVCIAPGAACVCHVRLGDPVAAWAVVLVLSMSLSAIVSVILVWARWWQPVAGLLIVATISAASCLLSLLRKEVLPPPAPPAAFQSGQSALPSSAETTLIPRISDETAIIPKITDETVPPKATSDALAERTALMAVLTVRIPSSDETMLLPKIPAEGELTLPVGGAADETTIIPKITDETTVIPRIPPKRESPAPAAPKKKDWLRSGQGQLMLGLLGLLAGFAAWGLSLFGARLDKLDDYGLLSTMHPVFYVTIAIAVLGFIVEVTQRKPRPWVAGGHTILLVLIMHATVPVLIAEPEYAWTYKHLGVIDLIAAGRPLDNAYDVYQQWPAFFSLMAQLSSAAGISSLRVAAWAPVFFGLINLLPVYAITRTLSTDRRVPYIAVFLFTAINWVAQDYLAPQAFAYTLSLGLMLVMLRWLRRDPLPPRGNPRLMTRLWTWVQAGMGQVPYTARPARRLALITLYVVYTAIAVSHQLSPYLIAISAAALIVFRLVQPVQILPIFGVIAVLQLVPRYRLVESWGLFDGFNLFANAQPAGPTAGAVSAGRTFSVLVVQILALAIWLLAALVVLANRKQLGPFAVPAALAAGPFAVLLGNSYGGEAVFRVFLFSSPWCAYLITLGLLRLRLRRELGIGLAAPALVLVTLIAIQGEHGQLKVNAFTPNEVAAANHLYATIPNGSAVVMAGANFPDRLHARYTDVLGAVGATDVLLPTNDSEGAVVLGEAMDQSDLDSINSYFQQYQVPAFLVISRSQAQAAEYFGYYPSNRLTKLRTLVEASPRWTVWHVNPDTQIYRYAPITTVTQ